MKYTFATNINGTDETGIINIQEQEIICLCSKEQSLLLLKALEAYEQEEDNEPYFGWCEVEGCQNEGANGGGCWRETGYWTVCSEHSSEFREGKPQPKMKQSAIDREKTRLPNGYLP